MFNIYFYLLCIKYSMLLISDVFVFVVRPLFKHINTYMKKDV